MEKLRILHLHSTFDLGGKEARAVRLMNHFGDSAAHTVLTAVPCATSARDMIAGDIDVMFPAEAPSLAGKPAPLRYIRLARYMRKFDLVLSYNWGSMDGVMAHRLLGGRYRLPPLIHHEDGFNEDEAVRLNWKRNGFRRLALARAHALVVPSRTLETIAAQIWHQPSARFHRIANGIDVHAYAAPCADNAIPGFTRRSGEVIVGTLAGLRAVKNIPRLVRALAGTGPNVRLVVVGEGPEKAAIRAEAAKSGVSDRLMMPGFLTDPHRFMGLFDIFALSSDSEQFPISLVEAMAAGLPVLSTDVGDVRHMLPPANAGLLAAPDDEQGFGRALRTLCADAGLRQRLGAENREYAARQFDERTMLERYTRLYASAIGARGVRLGTR